MKKRLRFILFVISAILILTILSCKKEHQYMNTAEITVDNRTNPCFANDPCSCPGGFFVFIDNFPNPCINFRHKALTLPSDFIIKSNLISPQLPISVKIDWKFDTVVCNDVIDIIRIARR